MDRYTMHGSNGGVRPIESDTGEWVKFEDVLISNTKQLDFTDGLLKEKDDKIAELEKVIADAIKITKRFAG
jgi:hypothetical protein